MNRHSTERAAQSKSGASFGVRRRVAFTAFAVVSSTSLLLILGALGFHWMTARALGREIAALQRASREPLGAVFAVIQSSWGFYASPTSEVAYGSFTETLAKLPDEFGSSASELASAGEAMRKRLPAGTATRSGGDGAQALGVALGALAQQAAGLTARHDAEVLRTLERYQDRALYLTGAGALLGVLVILTGLAHVRRVELVNSEQYEELVAEREKLKSLPAQLLAAQEQERRALARELHDGIGQSLSMLSMDATRAGTLAAAGNEQLRSVVASIRKTADELLQAVRDLALGLRPSMLDDLGLAAALDWLARETSRRSNVEVTLRADGLETPLPEQVSTCIYRVVQEGLTNAARHAGARTIEVRIQRSNRQVLIEIGDDGRGFDPKLKQGLGLTGAAERLAGLGGNLRIESSPGAGTRLLGELPIAEELG